MPVIPRHPTSCHRALLHQALLHRALLLRVFLTSATLAGAAWLGSCNTPDANGTPNGSPNGTPNGSPNGSPTPAPTTAASGPQAADLADAPLGAGWVVWESSRSGAWRIWGRELAGGPARQLSGDEPGRAHCCAHLAPDGQRLSFLSLPAGQEEYPAAGATGSLRLLELAAPSSSREIWPTARTYFEHRAAVWHEDQHLSFIDGDGLTRELDLASGATRVLQRTGSAAHGWLVDPTRRFATQGTPTFAPFDLAQGQVATRPSLGGCQPYFTADGRGFWVAGAGGPIRWIDLEGREVGEILRKGDRRLPADRRYLYFPMVSRDRRVLVWGASHDEHDHRRADYDIFVAPLDPQTLALAGPPRRVTADPATDRFPDVQVARLDVALEPMEVTPTVANPSPVGAAEDEILAWRGARHHNLVRDPASGQEQTSLFERQGRVFWDARFAADFAGGVLVADLGTMQRVWQGARATNEFCLEMVLTAREVAGPATLLQFGDDRRPNNFALTLAAGQLSFELLTASTHGLPKAPTLTFGPLRAGEQHHLAICYRAGRLEASLDGRLVAQSDAWLEGFFDWRELPLVAGRNWRGDQPFFGTIQRLVLRNRQLAASEIADLAAAAGALATPAPAVRARLALVEASPPPRLEEISPYREALAVYQYRVVQLERGNLPGATVRVVHHVLADGESLPITRLAPGQELVLELDPFADQPQLESLYLKNSLGPSQEPLYFSTTIDPAS